MGEKNPNNFHLFIFHFISTNNEQEVIFVRTTFFVLSHCYRHRISDRKHAVFTFVIVIICMDESEGKERSMWYYYYRFLVSYRIGYIFTNFGESRIFDSESLLLGNISRRWNYKTLQTNGKKSNRNREHRKGRRIAIGHINKYKNRSCERILSSILCLFGSSWYFFRASHAAIKHRKKSLVSKHRTPNNDSKSIYMKHTPIQEYGYNNNKNKKYFFWYTAAFIHLYRCFSLQTQSINLCKYL